jgi:hypothetical protein
MTISCTPTHLTTWSSRATRKDAFTWDDQLAPIFLGDGIDYVAADSKPPVTGSKALPSWEVSGYRAKNLARPGMDGGDERVTHESCTGVF